MKSYGCEGFLRIRFVFSVYLKQYAPRLLYSARCVIIIVVLYV